ncbi:MAG: tRNA lysidine(34) synthetase TilS [Christensenellaceae bacterium]|jgi:tRNA(Ile)-lysidine synthetase-like protein|nr:tRNA lysidine(34) synthetase TilS [Christensenellaceae bacterium]
MNITFNTKNKIGIGVSGGVDSMVLLELMRRADANIIVINIDHGIRGIESEMDSNFVIDYCKKHNIPYIHRKIQTLTYSKSEKTSIELSARILRYNVFDELLATNTVDVIALAHHSDDQIETLLLRIFRGASVRGMRGIVDRVGYIHPLLNYSKNDILDFAKTHNLVYVNDNSNNNLDYSRNYVRNALIPIIAERFPSYKNSLLRITTTMQEVNDFITSQLIPFKMKNNAYSLPTSLFEAHPVIAKNSIAELLRNMHCENNITATHYNSILNLKNSINNSILVLPNDLIVVKEYANLVFYKASDYKFNHNYSELFSLNKDYITEYFFLTTKPVTKIDVDTFDSDKIPSNSIIRTLKRGDSFTKFGGGTKSLSDYYTDIKLPHLRRKNQPVIAVNNIIYAIPGIAISEHLRIDNSTKYIYKFVFKEFPDATL